MSTKTIAIAVQIEGDAQLRQLQANFDQVSNARKALNKSERDGLITSKQASKQRADLNVQLKANRNALTDHQNALLKNNNALKKNSGFVAGVRKGMGQWAISMIGITAAIAGVTKLVGSAAKIFKDFEKANSKLQSVLGATSDEMKKLKFQAKELGSVTSFTASQVAELQTEFAKLGFPTSDIINMTEATLNGAAALGSELGEQAALTGALLKQFGLDSEEAGRVNDVLAASASKSALDFSKLSTALPIVGATANTAGVSIERTTALLGTLSDRGLDASTSGTSLRNIFLELSKKGLTFDEAMQQINTSTDKNKTAMDLFGKRSATAGIILAETGGSVDKLTESLENSDGAAKQMADTMLDNLAGDTDKAKSAWEGFVLSVESGDGKISKGLRSVVQGFSGVLNGLTKLNRTLKEVQLEKLSHQFKVFADTGKQAAKDVASDFKKAGIEGDNLTAAIERATVRAKENYKQAKARKDLNMSISYFEEWKALKELLNPTEKNTEETDTELTDKEKNARKKAADERAKMKADEIKMLRDLEIQMMEEGLGKELAAENAKFDDKIQNAIEKYGAETEVLAKLEEQRIQRLNGVRQEFESERIAKEEEEKETKREQQNAEDEAFFQKEKERLDKEYAQEQENARKLAELETIKRESRLATLNAAAGVFDSFSKLAKEGSNEQKALATAGALINTYAGAAAALAPPPIGAGPIIGPLIAASTIANGISTVAKINGIKFEDGGVLNGPSHANGGIPFSVGGQLGFEAEGGEAIINKRSTQMFAPLLSAINEAGGGVAFERGGRLTKFQGGGALPSNVGVTASQQGFASGSLDLEEFSSAIVDGINDKTVVNVATSTTDTATEVLNIASEASF